MSMQTIIEQKLAGDFDIDFLRVEIDSHMHTVAPGAESHFKVTIVSDAFEELMLIKRHRMVNHALREEMQQIHALALHTLTPLEWRTRGGEVAASPKCRGGGKNQ